MNDFVRLQNIAARVTSAVCLLILMAVAPSAPAQDAAGPEQWQQEVWEELSDELTSGWQFHDFFLTVEPSENLETLHMSRIESDSDDNIWALGGARTMAGDYEGLLFRYQDNEWEIVDRFEIATEDSSVIKALPLLVVSQFNVYYSDGYNLRRYSHGDILEYTPESSGMPEPAYEDERMVDIIRDEDNVNWLLYSYPRLASFGDPEGDYEVYDYENSAMPEPDEDPGIGTDLPARHLAVTEDSLWVTTHRDGDGLIRKYDDDWQVYTAENSDLTSDLVVSLLDGPDGSLWISTMPGEAGEGSLSQLDSGQWDVHTTADGLPSEENRIHAIEDNGFVWAAFGSGGFGSDEDDPGFGFLAEYTGEQWNTVAQTDQYFQYLSWMTIDDLQNKWLAGTFNVIDGGAGSLNQVYLEFTDTPDPESHYEAGDEVTLSWDAGPRVRSTTLSYRIDNEPRQVIEAGMDTSQTSRTFELPAPDQHTGDITFRISYDDNDDISDESEPIPVINPDEPFYHLRTENPDGSFTLYDPMRDGWNFSNTEANMWPESKWDDIEYEGPLSRRPFNGDPWMFPSFDSLIRAFGEDDTITGHTPIFNNIIPTLRASIAWPVLTNMGFNGVCHGFAVKSLLAFSDGFSALDSVIEEDSLYKQEPTHEIRKNINTAWVQQWSRDHFIENFLNTLNRNLLWDLLDLIEDGQNVTLDDFLDVDLYLASPSQTLGDIRDMLDTPADQEYQRALLMFPEGDVMGAHSVLVYKAEQSESDPDIWRLYIHDSNHPDNTNTYVEVDLDEDYYSYTEPGGNVRFEGNHGLFLSDRVIGYASESTLLKQKTVADQDNPVDQIDDLEDVGFMHTFFGNENDIRITDEMDNEASLQNDRTTSDIPGSFPIVPLVGGEQNPMGYFLVDVEYDVELSYPNGGEGLFQTFSGDTVYTYRNHDGQQGVDDRLRYGNSISVYGNDHEFDMEVMEDNDTRQRMYALRDVSIAGEDSIDFQLENDGRLAVSNYGESTEFDLELRTDYSDTDYFRHEGVTFEEGSAYRVEIDDWDELQDQEVTLHVDSDMDGNFDESQTLENVATSGEQGYEPDTPDEFGLKQNYPNPFNNQTTIRYELPEASHVELVIYDALGRHVHTLVDEQLDAGMHEAQFDAEGLSSGVYVYVMRAGDYVASKQLMLMK